MAKGEFIGLTERMRNMRQRIFVRRISSRNMKAFQGTITSLASRVLGRGKYQTHRSSNGVTVWRRA